MTRNRNTGEENKEKSQVKVKVKRNNCCETNKKITVKKISTDLDSIKNERTSTNLKQENQQLPTVSEEYSRSRTQNMLLPPLSSNVRPLPKLSKTEGLNKVNKQKRKNLKPIDDPYELDDFNKIANFIKQTPYIKNENEISNNKFDKEESVKPDKVSLDSDEGGSILWPKEKNSFRSNHASPLENYSYKPSSANGIYSSKRNDKL